MSHSETTIDEVGSQFQFSCECGVKGELRDNRLDAEADVVAHVEANRE